jgi:hypothetical protein
MEKMKNDSFGLNMQRNLSILRDTFKGCGQFSWMFVLWRKFCSLRNIMINLFQNSNLCSKEGTRKKQLLDQRNPVPIYNT